MTEVVAKLETNRLYRWFVGLAIDGPGGIEHGFFNALLSLVDIYCLELDCHVGFASSQ